MLSEDYVRTARAKGLTSKRIDDRHVLRNAVLPISTVIGLQTGLLLGGALLTEQTCETAGRLPVRSPVRLGDRAMPDRESTRPRSCRSRGSAAAAGPRRQMAQRDGGRSNLDRPESPHPDREDDDPHNEERQDGIVGEVRDRNDPGKGDHREGN